MLVGARIGIEGFGTIAQDPVRITLHGSHCAEEQGLQARESRSVKEQSMEMKL